MEMWTTLATFISEICSFFLAIMTLKGRENPVGLADTMSLVWFLSFFDNQYDANKRSVWLLSLLT